MNQHYYRSAGWTEGVVVNAETGDVRCPALCAGKDDAKLGISPIKADWAHAECEGCR